MTDNTLRIERSFQAPAQAVFDAWTSEEVMRRWWHAEHDWETTEAQVDLRVGGELRVVMRNPHDGAEYGGGGRYTEIEPPTRLAFTWLWDDNTTRTLIELDFEEADGVTTVHFTHSGLWDEAVVRSHEEGWTGAFDNLDRALAARHTHVHLLDVEDAAPANGFGERWEARVARTALGAEQTGVTHFRLRPGMRSPFTHRHGRAEEIYVILSGSGRIKLDDELADVRPLDAIRVAPDVARAFEAGPDGLEFLAFGAHHEADGEPVTDTWTA